MRARIIVNFPMEVKKLLGFWRWSIWDVVEIKITQSGYKYPRWTKWIYCKRRDDPTRTTRFYWYEVELLNSETAVQEGRD